MVNEKIKTTIADYESILKGISVDMYNFYKYLLKNKEVSATWDGNIINIKSGNDIGSREIPEEILKSNLEHLKGLI
jgi:hypothetical protein